MNGVVLADKAQPSGGEVDLSGRDITITIDLDAGQASGFVWTTDLSEAYVRLNSEYTT